MQSENALPNLTPAEYELAVKEILDGAGLGLTDFTSSHLERIAGVDGSYVIDVTIRFSALGADFLVLVECKHERRRVERQDVQVLHDKLRSVGAQKAMLFSIAGFQEGALEYADVHGIALAQLVSGHATWFTRSAGERQDSPVPPGIPEFCAWWCSGRSRSLMSADSGGYTRKALGVEK